ncbi:hypothetical protein BH24ACT22_BH24ACT22_12090 [soil metagenome]
MIVPEPETEPSTILAEVRDFLSRNTEFYESSAEELSGRLGTQPWVIEAALEALLIEGEVRS